MHPNHVIALAHQHHAGLLTRADHRRIARWARRNRRTERHALASTRPARQLGNWGVSPPVQDLAL